MSVSKKGHLYQRGKSLQNDLRSLIIDEIVNEGGDIVNGYFQVILQPLLANFV